MPNTSFVSVYYSAKLASNKLRAGVDDILRHIRILLCKVFSELPGGRVGCLRIWRDRRKTEKPQSCPFVNDARPKKRKSYRFRRIVTLQKRKEISKKVLTRGRKCGILAKLSRKTDSGTLKIKQRKSKNE